MAIHWSLVRDFAYQNISKFSLLPAWGSHPFILKRNWPESYEKTKLGYEASWAGVFEEQKK